MKILIDNGHGLDTPGKRSPAAIKNLPQMRMRADLLAAKYISPEYHEEIEALIEDLGLEFLEVEKTYNSPKVGKKRRFGELYDVFKIIFVSLQLLIIIVMRV